MIIEKRPALLPLVALTAMDNPERVIAETVEQLAQVPDQQERERLTIEFQALAPDGEIKAMIEHMLRRNNMVFHSPFLEEIREEGYKEGREEGLVEGIGKGREEGLVAGIGKGREEGRMLSVRENILDALTERFNPPAAEYRTIERTLEEIKDYTTLRSLFTQVLRAATVDEFMRAAAAQLSG